MGIQGVGVKLELIRKEVNMFQQGHLFFGENYAFEAIEA
jgi:hypothetical protein